MLDGGDRGRTTSSGEADLEEAGILNGSFVVAFIVMPLIVLAMGYAAVRLHEWDVDRRHRNDPAG